MPITSSFQQTAMEPWLRDILKSMAERAEFVRKEEYEPYAGERFAPSNEDLENAYMMARRVGDYQPYLEEAGLNIKRGSADYPSNFIRYMNPYQAQVLSNLVHYANRGFQEQTLPALERSFTGAGQHGSTLHAQFAQRAARDMQEALNRQMGEQLAHGYEASGRLFNADMARKLEAAELGPKLATAQQAGRTADISILGQVGEARKGEEQAKRDAAYEEYMRQRAYPAEALKQQAGIMEGYPTPQTTYSATQTPGRPEPNTLANLGALATGLYGLNMAYGGGRKSGGRIRRYAPGGYVMADEDKEPSNPFIYNARPQGAETMGAYLGAGIVPNRRPAPIIRPNPAIANHPFNQTSMMRQPKVGGVYSMNKGVGRI